MVGKMGKRELDKIRPLPRLRADSVRTIVLYATRWDSILSQTEKMLKVQCQSRPFGETGSGLTRSSRVQVSALKIVGGLLGPHSGQCVEVER